MVEKIRITKVEALRREQERVEMIRAVVDDMARQTGEGAAERPETAALGLKVRPGPIF